jgi:hypothetical protein
MLANDHYHHPSPGEKAIRAVRQNRVLQTMALEDNLPIE